MKETAREIKKALPDIKSEKVEILADELDRIKELKRVFDSEGGKELIKVLRDNCSMVLRKLIIKSRENPDLPTLLGLIASYSANIDLLSSMRDISTLDEIQDQLDEAVKEAYED